MFKLNCYSCNKPITTLGALIFGPPFKNNIEMSVSTVHKYHICISCWQKLIKHIEELGDKK